LLLFVFSCRVRHLAPIETFFWISIKEPIRVFAPIAQP
jgi:hypothetical protein